jgi:hypothetical protein
MNLTNPKFQFPLCIFIILFPAKYDFNLDKILMCVPLIIIGKGCFVYYYFVMTIANFAKIILFLARIFDNVFCGDKICVNKTINNHVFI